MKRKFKIKYWLLFIAIVFFVTTKAKAQSFCWETAVNKDLELSLNYLNQIQKNPTKNLKYAENLTNSKNLDSIAKAWKLIRALDIYNKDYNYTQKFQEVLGNLEESAIEACKRYIIGTWNFKYCGSFEKVWPNQIEQRTKLKISESSVNIYQGDSLIESRTFKISLVSKPNFHNQLFFDFNFLNKGVGIAFRVTCEGRYLKQSGVRQKLITLYFKSNCGADCQEIVFEAKNQ